MLLLQHGEKRRTAGDPVLTSRGRAQAEAAARLLTRLHPVALVSSPLARARETIAPLSDALGLDVDIDLRLRERMNLDAGESVEEFVRAWSRSSTERSWSPPRGRSSCSTARDMMRAVESHAVDGSVVVLATHGGATIDLLRSVLGDDELERRAPALIQQGVPGGAVTSLVPSDGSWAVHTIADDSHVPGGQNSGHAPA
ncbi:histidine phosphatase family protein [Brachybacterium sp. MASK1Z-5]|uniref:Histidine phosphatase family protein n=1 Tax=Brachybacterium halotolerans TaxID=2795215 RepID=A0ABS1B879_9MICO|nr:histidine phosphatase family protein [Brachybacterium halotolerans]